jgi:hypothetical protein
VSAVPHLPDLLRRYVERVLEARTSAPQQLLVTPTGEMISKPGGRRMRFTARERFAVERVAFSCEARFPTAWTVSIKVSDSYADGAGSLRVRAVGLPLQRRSGPALAISEAYRYLAELPWGVETPCTPG